MIRFHALTRITVTVLAVLASSSYAQPTMTTFKNFKHYPTSGQWQQELVGYRDNKPLGPPVTSSSCVGPLNAAMPPALMGMAKASSSTCSTTTIIDQPLLAESESVCNIGGRTQTIRVQLRAIDDHTLTSETRSAIAGMPETLMKSKVTYLGACTAGAQTTPKPTAEDCSEIAKMRQDLNESAANGGQCASLPPTLRAQCETRIKSSAGIVAALEAQCK